MKGSEKKVDANLNKKFQRVLATPASFDFYVAIHDFIEHIEQDSSLSKGLSDKLKANRELDIPSKYTNLKRIYQGVQDINIKTKTDLGHERYMVISELNRIQKKDVSESNSFWKKRELFRKLTGIVYDRLNTYLSE